jgi:putative drug exporter of the RND superfamily
VTALTEWVLRHRRWVALAWVLVAAAGAFAAPRAVDRLSYDFALPGQPAYEANVEIAERFGGGGVDDPLLLVVQGEDAGAAVGDVAAQAQEAVPGTRVVTPDSPGAEVLAHEGEDVAVAVLYPPVTAGADSYAGALPRLDEVVEAAQADGTDVELTGFALLSEGGAQGDRSVLAEVLLGGVGALIVLALVFGSLLAGVPLLVAAVSILGTFLALLGLTYLTDVVFVVQYLVALIGLGVAIDYSLLVVTRWREERAGGLDNDDAVRRAMATAGRSVVFSGFTVAVSLAALVLVPLPFLRSIGFGGLLIPLLSVATAVTLVPALLSTAGPGLTWPRRGAQVRASRAWAGIARTVVRHRWLTIAGTSAVLLALAYPVLGLTLGSPQLSGITSDSAGSQAITRAVEAGVPDGVLRPVEVLADGDEAQELESVEGVAAASAPADAAWRDGGTQLLQVYLTDDPASAEGKAALESVRTTVGKDVVGGSAAEDADFVTAVYGDAVWVVLAIMVVTFLLLARALRSLWLPVKALALNVVSIAAAYGVTVLIWQEGIGSELLFGQPATGVITTWVPIAAFAFLFGLSMDYEVFILARMREAYDEHGDTDRAVVDGISHTGRLVTSAALILFLSFVALSTVPSVEVKILATTLALGILLDAVVVRGLLAPALVAALGHLNWTMPGPLRRVLRVPLQPVQPAPRDQRRRPRA